MALEGSLKEFGLADILQLLYYQRKTGVLNLEGRLDKVRLLFHEGKIVLAESKRRADEQRLGKILIKKGVLKEQDFIDAMKEQKTAGGKLGHSLIKKGLVTKEQIQEILSAQITETVTHLLTWKEGRYEFKPQGVPLDREIPLSLDTQHLLMEGLRIVDEWSVIEGRISLDSVFVKTGATTGGLSREEEEVLDSVDGQNDVSAIADLTGIDNIHVSKTLLGLLDRGLVAPKTEEVPAPEAVAKAPALPVRKKVSIVFIAIPILVALVFSVLTVPMLQVDFRWYNASKKIDDLSRRIDVYRYEKGVYPPALGDITREMDPWGAPYVYTALENGFTLFSAGPDRAPGTKDDIR